MKPTAHPDYERALRALADDTIPLAMVPKAYSFWVTGGGLLEAQPKGAPMTGLFIDGEWEFRVDGGWSLD